MCDALLLKTSCPNQELHRIQKDRFCAGLSRAVISTSHTHPASMGWWESHPISEARAVLQSKRCVGCRADALLEPGHHQRGDSG